jgi:N-formylglutamate amidohydrolase
MFNHDHPAKEALFDFYAPLTKIPRGMISIPHSGELIPLEFERFLVADPRAHQEDVDFKVNELVDIPQLQRSGIGVLVARVHRICVDLNRSQQNSVLCWPQNTQNAPLVIKTPDEKQIEQFIDIYHRPYFEILKAQIQELEKIKTHPVSFIDLHSMPSKPSAYHFKQNPHQKNFRADFCLSDRHGKTCVPEFISFFQQQLQAQGFSSAINDPYIGGFITEFADRFRTNNIQIEINRSLYMDESTKELILPKAMQLKAILTDVLIRGFEEFDS